MRVPEYTPPPPTDTTPTLLTGGSIQYKPDLRALALTLLKEQRPNWRVFLNAPEVQLWRAIALSLNIPISLDTQLSHIVDGHIIDGNIEDFKNRMAIAVSHMRPTGELSHVIVAAHYWKSYVRLADIARLAEVCTPKWELPPEFPAAAVPVPAISSPLVVSEQGGLSQDAAIIAELSRLAQNPAIKLHYKAQRAFGFNMQVEDNLSKLKHEKGILEGFKLGRYTLAESAIELAEKTGWDASRWLSTIQQAVEGGKLSLKNPMDYTDKLPYAVPEKLRSYRDQVSAVDVNAWLATHPEWEVTARLNDESVGELTSQSAPVKAEVGYELDESALSQPSKESSAPPDQNPALAVQRWQEREVLRVIKELGYDPTKLPPYKQGGPGVKSDVRGKLTGNKWQGTIFNKAWERLSSDKKIAYAK